ncbi:hypothetical protein EDC14_102237 [Hydrogenispora ethanolica]|jgi:hypothetical protein|uniref:Uncharacterized protein n=1 Tax=Hydrogenispora ethanolica TaxID=1082276 RepID=A0A4R1RB31_HYDET|nr:hypothetical protein [Hydrogenispora ethanolica]TCL62983.1 hypothetical protein EDC14_102237 [Hydrogenispora ethanolica]
MSTALSVISSIERLSQSIAALLGNTAAFPAFRTTLITTFELIKGAVRELPVRFFRQQEILQVLNQAETIVSGALAITIQELNTILGLLQLATLKVTVFTDP